MEIFNPQFLAQYSKLDSIQVLQFLMLILVGGLMMLNYRQQGAGRQTTQNFNDMTSKLLATMQSQQNQSNDREGKLATSIDRQANESNKIARALILIHKEQKKQGEKQDTNQQTIDRYHTETLNLINEVKHEINGLKEVAQKEPGQHNEMMAAINQVLGYVEGLRLKVRTGETSKFATGEQPKYTPDARSEDSSNGTMMPSQTIS